MTVLFFYGTLKSGEQSNHLLAGQRFVGPARTVPIYRLYGIGWHPGLVVDRQSGLAVHGELWAVDDAALARLDEYEGIPDYFRREAIAIADHFGEVQAYFFNGTVPDDAPTGDRWPMPV
ncbi:MAG TPA: gamma-glutamylcyclotransferase family protein [Gemmataceae bacterium]|jgi:gamma-glutamylaminecyclotransferase|nr:gamma-glutamylcyclotransferase family protein [Gemmataceae bacterium]